MGGLLTSIGLTFPPRKVEVKYQAALGFLTGRDQHAAAMKSQDKDVIDEEGKLRKHLFGFRSSTDLGLDVRTG